MSFNSDKERKWKSIKEKNDPTSFIEAKKNEFSEGVLSEFNISEMGKISRRKFLAAIGMSAAFAACNNYRDKGTFSAQNKGDETIKPGKPIYFSSACSGCQNHCSIIVKTREGRPIKIDGNLDSHTNLGKICATGQASILNLYDPKRLKSARVKNGNKFVEIDTSEALKEFKKVFSEAAKGDKEFAFIVREEKSLLLKKAFEKLKSHYPNANVYSYSILGGKNLLQAWKDFYAIDFVPEFKIDEAEVIVSFNSDFLGSEGNFPKMINLFSRTRNVDNIKNFSRLYSFEGVLSLTGANSDYRIRIKPEHLQYFSLALINYFAFEKKFDYPKYLNAVIEASKGFSLDEAINKLELNRDYIEILIDDLIQKKGKVIFMPGENLPSETIIPILVLNEILQATKFYDYSNARAFYSYENIYLLKEKIKVDKIGAIAFLDSDPVFDLPYINFENELETFVHSFSFVESENDTSQLCKYQLPISHYLESWNIFEPSINSFVFQQPIISPIYDTLQKEEIILSLASNISIYEFFKEVALNEIYRKENLAVDFDAFLFAALQKGVYRLKNAKSINPAFSFSKNISRTLENNEKNISLELRYNYFLKDGKYANNGWLQEIPHPISKITWSNYAAISQKTASEYNLKDEDFISISIENETLKLPVLIQPGMADNLISIEIGYGRKKAGIVGDNVGFNANKFLKELYGELLFHRKIDKIKKEKGKYKLANVQEHHSLDDEFVKELHKKRSIILEATVAQYIANQNLFKEKKHEISSIVPPVEYKEEKWGMVIDLNKCVGCGACVAACNVENNIPVVGEEQVAKSREMHWIRIDRYYSGETENPKVSLQPMLCQHCDNAPCENVCPVVATTHSPDGLNQMAYNRCVGTRYCANNCPYKVRRFNFFNYRVRFADGIYYEEPARLLNNPEVTVRSRGVMEKCTFCVQRIMDAREKAIKENRNLRDGDIVTACQSACPADAIVFGNLNDLNSKVSYWNNHNLGYKVLEILNVKPNVTYIAKLRNTTEKIENKEA